MKDFENRDLGQRLSSLKRNITIIQRSSPVNVTCASSRDNKTRLDFRVDKTVFKLAKSSDTRIWQHQARGLRSRRYALRVFTNQ